jgi:hypothetical protein
VYGDSFQAKLVAVVHPKPGVLKGWAKAKGKSGARGGGGRGARCGEPFRPCHPLTAALPPD